MPQVLIADTENVYIELDEKSQELMLAYDPQAAELEVQDAWATAQELGFGHIDREYFDLDWCRYVFYCKRGGGQVSTHLSYSQLTAWTRCGKQYQLQRLQGAPEEPTVWLPAGTAVHSAFEALNHIYYERGKSNGNSTDLG